MDAFEEYTQFFDDPTIYKQAKKYFLKEELEECAHKELTECDGGGVCRECGCQVDILDFQPEWRYYGASDSRSSGDPSRCHRSKESSRGGIDKVFQDCKLTNFSISLRKRVEKKYKEVVGENTVRGKGRKAIVAACLLYTLREDLDFRGSDEVRSWFGLEKQDMSEGLTKYHARFPQDRISIIKPSDLVFRIIKMIGVNICHYKYIKKIAKTLEGVDVTLNRSNPQSVAAAIVYLYLCLCPKLKASMGITKTKFAKEVGLSDITITKLVKRAADVMGRVVDT